jgi:peptidoglycan/LPS O-acetylase OafA/YrhL
LFLALPSYLMLIQTWHYEIIGDHSLVFTFPAMTTITWSVSTEWFFYLLYPFACVALARLRRPRPIMLAIAGLVIAGYASVCWAATNLDAINAFGVDHYGDIARSGGADGFSFWLMYLSPFPHLFDFALGSLTAALFIALSQRPVSGRENWLGRWGLAFAIGSILIVFVLLFFLPARLPGQHAQAVLQIYFGFTPFIALLLFCCTRYPSRVSATLSRPWIVLGGEISYSIYMLHIGVVQFVQQFNIFANVATPPYTGWNMAHAVVTVIIVTAIVLSVSLLSYNMIEVPARRYLRRWLSLRLTRVVPATRDTVIQPLPIRD